EDKDEPPGSYPPYKRGQDLSVNAGLPDAVSRYRGSIVSDRRAPTEHVWGSTMTGQEHKDEVVGLCPGFDLIQRLHHGGLGGLLVQQQFHCLLAKITLGHKICIDILRILIRKVKLINFHILEAAEPNDQRILCLYRSRRRVGVVGVA